MADKPAIFDFHSVEEQTIQSNRGLTQTLNESTIRNNSRTPLFLVLLCLALGSSVMTGPC